MEFKKNFKILVNGRRIELGVDRKVYGFYACRYIRAFNLEQAMDNVVRDIKSELEAVNKDYHRRGPVFSLAKAEQVPFVSVRRIRGFTFYEEVDTANMIPAQEFAPSDTNNERTQYHFCAKARNFLSRQDWCRQINEAYLDIWCEGLLGVFLFEVEPVDSSTMDFQVWVIEGDMPESLISIEYAPNGACALMEYVTKVRLWIENVKCGKSHDGFGPVGWVPMPSHIEAVEGKLAVILHEILPKYERDLFNGGYTRSNGSYIRKSGYDKN